MDEPQNSYEKFFKVKKKFRIKRCCDDFAEYLIPYFDPYDGVAMMELFDYDEGPFTVGIKFCPFCGKLIECVHNLSMDKPGQPETL